MANLSDLASSATARVSHYPMILEKVARSASSSVFVVSSYPLIISFTMTTKQPVPNSLRFYRKQAGLRQVDVAAKLGFTSYDRISHWEKGLAFPSVTNLFRLSALYKVPAQELFGEYFKIIESDTQISNKSADNNHVIPTPGLRSETT